MRLRRLAAAEMVRTPAGAWPGRGFGVLPGGSRRTVMPSASTSTARTPCQVGVSAAQGRGGRDDAKRDDC